LHRLPFTAKVVAERLSGKSIFEAGYYRESVLTRLVNLFAHTDVEKWRGMRVLEVGAGLGHLGDAFVHLGFDVTSTDGRQENVDAMRNRGRRSFLLDLDKTGIDEAGAFDLVLAFGVLYHLAEPEKFLLSCENTQVLLLDTVVCDSRGCEIKWANESGGWIGKDQAVGQRGCRPSPVWVEETCRKAGFDITHDISSPLANWTIGIFDWESRDDGRWTRGSQNLRKMWVCERTSP